MKTFIRKMGNSHGVLIPKLMLEEIGVAAGRRGRARRSTRKAGSLSRGSPRTPGSGWEEECRALAGAGEFGLARGGGNPSGRDW